MLKAVKDLVTSEHDLTRDNHRVEYTEVNGHYTANFWYFQTIICSVDFRDETFKTNNGGWDTPSTNRAIKDYRDYYNSNGYSEVFDSPERLKEYLVSLPENKSCRVYFDHKQVTLKKVVNKLIEGLKVAHLTVCSEESILYDDSYSYKGPKSFESFINEVLFNILLS